MVHRAGENVVRPQAGVSSSVIGAPVGVGIATIGTAIKGTYSLSSLATFLMKKLEGTLGVERKQHADLLFGLALEHMQKNGFSPEYSESTVRQSLEYVARLGSLRDRQQASQEAFGVLNETGVLSGIDDPDFSQHGHEKIMALLKG